MAQNLKTSCPLDHAPPVRPPRGNRAFSLWPLLVMFLFVSESKEIGYFSLFPYSTGSMPNTHFFHVALIRSIVS